MANNVSTNANDYLSYLTIDDQNDFKKWNTNTQTSTQNFNKRVGIQIYTKNATATIAGYRDKWNGGQFYNGQFEGKWNGGQWISGYWNGWNSNISILGLTSTTSFQSPDTFLLSATQN